MANISTNITSPVTYAAGTELEFKLTISAPVEGTYYIVGALYDSDYNYISGTLFGVLLPSGATKAFNSQAQMSLWELEEDEEKEIDCGFTFDRTSMVMGLFLMRMVGETASIEDDVQVGSTSAMLAGAAAGGLDLGAIMTLLVVVGMMSMMMGAIKTD